MKTLRTLFLSYNMPDKEKRQHGARTQSVWLAHRLSAQAAALVLTLWITLFLNQALWKHLWALPDLDDAWGAKRLVLAAMLACGCYLWLLLWSWAKVRRWMWSATLLLAALVQFYMLRYGVMMDTSMVRNVLNTNTHEALALLTSALLWHVLVFAGVPMAWLWLCVHFKAQSWSQAVRSSVAWGAAMVMVTALLVAVGYQMTAPMVRTHKAIRYMMNPLAALVSANDVVIKPLWQERRPLLDIREGLALGRSYVQNPQQAMTGKPPLLVLVVGETTRGDHFSLNGYPRSTTPELAARDVLNWSNAQSCGTSTNVSVPCMFSHLGRTQFKRRAADYQNLLDLLQNAGLGVSWLDNQAGCQGVCARIPYLQADHVATPDAIQRWCKNGECLDRLMVEVLDKQLASLPAVARQRGAVLVLHQMGSHGPAYYRRSAADTKRFQEECQSNEIASCSHDALVNAYDNSMAETDKFLAQTIDWLQSQAGHYATSLLYVSDHGESLGEGGVYMHAAPYDMAPSAQTHIPWVWWPGQLPSRTGVDLGCVAKATGTPISHDNYFHTVLGLLDVQTPHYQAALDLLAPCRSTHAMEPFDAPDKQRWLAQMR